ncbi:hypothetical protein QJS10_CPB14g01331 [Acorus calamus]|uniref:Uncharacterized protein n=1 Tax=Acorus calamus TaxID=4465 RepID=A0AAV9DDZ7_ACOCL|nr:hypothetical protein QJS10_CPB14g01331 [Acorus calamus]
MSHEYAQKGQRAPPPLNKGNGSSQGNGPSFNKFLPLHDNFGEGSSTQGFDANVPMTQAEAINKGPAQPDDSSAQQPSDSTLLSAHPQTASTLPTKHGSANVLPTDGALSKSHLMSNSVEISNVEVPSSSPLPLGELTQDIEVAVILPITRAECNMQMSPENEDSKGQPKDKKKKQKVAGISKHAASPIDGSPPFFFTTVYASNSSSDRISLWADLVSLSSQTSGLPWILGGDFNEVRFISEKRLAKAVCKRSCEHRHSKIFHREVLLWNTQNLAEVRS